MGNSSAASPVTGGSKKKFIALHRVGVRSALEERAAEAAACLVAFEAVVLMRAARRRKPHRDPPKRVEPERSRPFAVRRHRHAGPMGAFGCLVQHFFEQEFAASPGASSRRSDFS